MVLYVYGVMYVYGVCTLVCLCTCACVGVHVQVCMFCVCIVFMMICCIVCSTFTNERKVERMDREWVYYVKVSINCVCIF